MPDLSLYKVCQVTSLEECGKNRDGKVMRACKVDVGESVEITVVTVASVKVGDRLVVAPVGSIVELDSGEEITIKKAPVSGVMSEGMFCDSKMLGWTGGAQGVAVQIPDSIALGSEPPSSKPRPGGAATVEPDAGKVEGLFSPKMSKEEKKKIAEEKRKAKKAAKEAKDGNSDS
jgi:tRNA-binding EMAP/Myf-like protein